ncbi:MAG: phospho-N-acetylmuramoyl-pentapeptide-transferase [bacterium]|nr:phospho-N-acetylmuramoyl-pentapeptide-transferase [bacterium]
MEVFVIVKILFLTTLSAIIAVAWTPLLTHFLYKYKLGKSIRSEGLTPVFNKLHIHKTGTPTMGGLIIWVTVLILILGFYYASLIFTSDFFAQMNFLSQRQTLLPLGALVATALVGLFDDILDVRSHGRGGLNIKHRLLIYTLIALAGALWFFFKLDWTVIQIPFYGFVDIGSWSILLFIFVIVGTAFSVNEIDGLDGLSGGTLLTAFGAYGAIAFFNGKFDLAALCGVIIGALIAFLWFNIKPARFYMGDTGAMSLGVTLGMIAILTNQIFLLPMIGFLFVVESFSVIIQVVSKKFRNGKKIFLSAPIHHHLEALGWPEYKIVMRFWLISGVTAAIGLIIFLIDKITT